jgi:hypothetical protein
VTDYQRREREALRQFRLAVLLDPKAAPEDKLEAKSRLVAKPARYSWDALSIAEMKVIQEIWARARGETSRLDHVAYGAWGWESELAGQARAYARECDRALVEAGIAAGDWHPTYRGPDPFAAACTLVAESGRGFPRLDGKAAERAERLPRYVPAGELADLVIAEPIDLLRLALEVTPPPPPRFPTNRAESAGIA